MIHGFVSVCFAGALCALLPAQRESTQTRRATTQRESTQTRRATAQRESTQTRKEDGGRELFTIAPYLQNVTRSGISLCWQQQRSGPAFVRYRERGQRAPWRRHNTYAKRRAKSIRLEKLRPGTPYEYGVSLDGRRWYAGRFVTAPWQDAPFKFLVLGDTRRGRPQDHKAVVEAMRLESPALIFNTGDLVRRAAAESWETFFRIEAPVLRNAPLYAALGNHEIWGGRVAGIRLFRRYLELPRNGPDPEIVYALDYGNTRFIVLNSNTSFLGSRQSKWAVERMEQGQADPRIEHVFLVLHHGPYSSGPHGSNQRLVESGLLHCARRTGVDFVFSGHDHLYERGAVDGLRYVVTAGGGAPLYAAQAWTAHARVVEAVHHYVRVAIHGREVELAAVRTDGSLIDTFHYVKRADSERKGSRFVVLHDAHPRMGRNALAGGRARSTKEATLFFRAGRRGHHRERDVHCPTHGGEWIWLVVVILGGLSGVGGAVWWWRRVHKRRQDFQG
jgi:predicted phosphodiesterase